MNYVVCTQHYPYEGNTKQLRQFTVYSVQNPSTSHTHIKLKFDRPQVQIMFYIMNAYRTAHLLHSNCCE
jgi:hypothetical protein